MRVFNRIAMTLLFAGLFVLGVYMVVYAFDLFGYKLASLPISDFSGGLADNAAPLAHRAGGQKILCPHCTLTNRNGNQLSAS